MPCDDCSRSTTCPPCVQTSRYDWLLLLPREALAECVAELVESAPTPQFDATFASWKATAEVYGDPELSARLATGTDGDFGPVPPPCVCLCHTLEDEQIISTCVCCTQKEGS